MLLIPRAPLIVSVAAILLISSWALAQSERGDPRNGQLIYERHCLQCHGVALDGNGPRARDLIVPPANLTSPESRAKTDWELLLPIHYGILFSPMHGWRDRLTSEQIRDVLSYIRMVAPFDAIG